jgi:phospholipid/cholesterol/gamma-HCH transport system ATP-binding protein
VSDTPRIEKRGTSSVMSRNPRRIPIIEFDDVSMAFDGHSVYAGISFCIFEGENVGLIGPSGTGKSVLLKLISGLLTPTSGKVKIRGADIAMLDKESLINESREIGMLFQGAALFDSLTVFDNIAFPLREHNNGTEAQIRKIVTEKLHIVGLSGDEDKFPAELSGGMKKRVGLARVLVTSPRIILFDEPTTGLDPTTRALIEEIIIKLRDDHRITSVIVTHDMESAHRMVSRLILLSDGRIQADGPASELWEGDKKVHDFASGHWKQAGADLL